MACDRPAVAALTGGDGVDHVVETVGGGDLNMSLAAVRIGGSVSVIGLIAGRAAEVNTDEFVTTNVTVHGIETGSHEMHAELAAFVDEHGLVPVPDSVRPIEQIRGALRCLERGDHLGKIVVSLAAAGGQITGRSCAAWPPGSARPAR